MYNLYFQSARSAVSAMKVILVRHRRPFQSDVHKRRRYRAENCVEICLYQRDEVTLNHGRDEAVTQRWPDRW